MLGKLEKLYCENVLKWFCILLPIVEAMTTYMILHLNMRVTIGMIYKTLFLLYIRNIINGHRSLYLDIYQQ